jgi:hypothetical protein
MLLRLVLPRARAIRPRETISTHVRQSLRFYSLLASPALQANAYLLKEHNTGASPELA